MVSVNPFATRFLRPDRIMPLDAGGQPIDVAALLDRLDAVGGRAAIVGPHGSGKSNLLIRLQEQAVDRGWCVGYCRLGGNAWQDAAVAGTTVLRAASGGLVCIDSWERLGPLTCRGASLAARRRGCRLLVTSHGPTGLPVLIRCQPTAAILAAIVRQLPDAGHWLGDFVRDDDIHDAFTRHAPNLREALFHLYDLVEARRRFERQAVGL